MKRILFSIIYILISFISVAQSKDCKYKTKYDEFEKTTRYSVENKFLTASLSSLGYSVYAFKKNDTFLGAFIMFSVNGTGGCRASNSYVSFMFDDNEVKEYKYTGEIDCGTHNISIDLQKADLELLASKKVTKIRVCFDYPKDYDVSENKIVKFAESLKCILSEF